MLKKSEREMWESLEKQGRAPGTAANSITIPSTMRGREYIVGVSGKSSQAEGAREMRESPKRPGKKIDATQTGVGLGQTQNWGVGKIRSSPRRSEENTKTPRDRGGGWGVGSRRKRLSGSGRDSVEGYTGGGLGKFGDVEEPERIDQGHR